MSTERSVKVEKVYSSDDPCIVSKEGRGRKGKWREKELIEAMEKD